MMAKIKALVFVSLGHLYHIEDNIHQKLSYFEIYLKIIIFRNKERHIYVLK